MQNLRKTNETGRSMVEMLGVLSIVGVFPWVVFRHIPPPWKNIRPMN